VEARYYKARQFLTSFGFEEFSEMTEEVFGQAESVVRLRHVAS
jgi:hypothetical protein